MKEVYNINIKWLLSGKGEMFNKKRPFGMVADNTTSDYFVEQRCDYQQPCIKKIMELSKKLNHAQRYKLVQFILIQYDIKDLDDLECTGENNNPI